MKRKRFIVGEWIMRVTGSSKAHPDRIRVLVENVNQPDLQFAQAVAKVVEVWIASGGRR